MYTSLPALQLTKTAAKEQRWPRNSRRATGWSGRAMAERPWAPWSAESRRTPTPPDPVRIGTSTLGREVTANDRAVAATPLNGGSPMRTSLRAAVLACLAVSLAVPATASARQSDLWKVYNQTLRKARYIDLTHTITPFQPVWKGFGPATFRPAVDPATGRRYTYAEDGFEATSYTLATDQFGTQFDPPAHWAPEQAAIDEVPASYSVRPLVVINVAAEVKRDPQYFLHVADIKAWEKQHGRIPAGAVVFVRSDWSKRWTADPVAAKELAASRD